MVDASKSVVVVSNGRCSFLRGREREREGGKRETVTERGGLYDFFMCKSKKILYQLCHLCYMWCTLLIILLIDNFI